MEEKKSIFVSFAEEDVRQRNALKDHPLLTGLAFDFADFAIKDPRSNNWKDRVHLAIRRARGVIVLVSSNSLASSGQRWEISCAKTEKKPMLEIWAYSNDRTFLPGIVPVVWSWEGIRRFVDSV